MNKILIIKLNNSSFENWYLKKLTNCGVDVCDLRDLVNSNSREGILDIQMYSHVDKYANVNNWNRYDEIILFDAVFLVPAYTKQKRGSASFIYGCGIS